MLIFTLDGDVLVLIVASDKGPPKAVRSTSSSLVLGSAPDCDVVVAEATARHARIERSNKVVTLDDLDSPGGTFVNGKRVYQARLRSGDQILLAPDPPAPQRSFPVEPIPQVTVNRKGGQSLLHLSVALAKPGTLEEKLDEILKYSLMFGSFDRAAVWVQDPEQDGEFLLHRHRQAKGRPPVEVSQTILAQVLKGEALIIGDAALDRRVEKARSVQMQNVRTCVALPLRTTDRIWGVLYLDCLDPRPLSSKAEQEFLVGFASLAAVAVANSWLTAQAQKQTLIKDRLRRFFPPSTMDKILRGSQGPLAGAELKVTILFCDIRNYTGISYEQPPKRVAAWLNDYFSRIVPLVFRHGGTLEKYIGDALSQKSYSCGFPFVQKRNHGERLQYYTENSHPAIIDRDTFERVQALLQKKAQKEKKRREKSPLALKIVCGNCGTVFQRRSSQNGYVTWVCRTHDRHAADCPVGRIPEAEIHAAFLRMYHRLKSNADIILAPALRQLNTLDTILRQNHPQVLAINRAIAEATEESHKISTLRANGLLDADICAARMNAISARLAQLRGERRRLTENEAIDETMDALRKVEQTLLNGPERLDGFDEVLFEHLVEKIMAESQNRIRFRLYGGLELTEQWEVAAR